MKEPACAAVQVASVGPTVKVSALHGLSAESPSSPLAPGKSRLDVQD